MKSELIQTNQWKLTIEVGPERFEEGMKHSYNLNKTKINIQGFRKGKAPRKLIESQYGKQIFFEEAVNFVIQGAYEAALAETKLDVVSRPEIDVLSVSTEEGVVFEATVFVKPEVKISDYKGITYKKTDKEPSEEEIEKEFTSAREKNARLVTITDRPVALGDKVKIDFEGFMDDVAFEGGKAEDYELVIGSKTFIDTFEEQLVGKSIDDEFDVNVNFPEGYQKEELSGKPAVFKVKINGITMNELPELNDDFAQDVSEFDTLEAYRNDIIEKLSAKKADESERRTVDQIMMKLIENAEIELPQIMVDNQVNQMLNDMAQRLQQGGMNLEMYLQYTGQTKESLEKMYQAPATNQVKGRLILEQISVQENLDATEAELDEEINRLAEMYKMPADKFKVILRPEDYEGLKQDIIVKKASEFVIENAIEEE